MASDDEKAKLWRFSLIDLGVVVTGFCISLALALASVARHRRYGDYLPMTSATGETILGFASVFIFGGIAGYSIEQLLGKASNGIRGFMLGGVIVIVWIWSRGPF